MLEKRKVLDQIECKQDGHIFMKELNQIVDNGEVIQSIPHRSVFTPDMEFDSLPDVVKPYANLLWTEEVKQAFEARKQANKLG